MDNPTTYLSIPDATILASGTKCTLLTAISGVTVTVAETDAVILLYDKHTKGRFVNKHCALERKSIMFTKKYIAFQRWGSCIFVFETDIPDTEIDMYYTRLHAGELFDEISIFARNTGDRIWHYSPKNN